MHVTNFCLAKTRSRAIPGARGGRVEGDPVLLQALEEADVRQVILQRGLALLPRDLPALHHRIPGPREPRRHVRLLLEERDAE